MKTWGLIFLVCFNSCASNAKINPTAPLNIPKPNSSKSTEKLTEELNKIKITIDSADARLERIKILFEGLKSN